jgi:dTDP-4-dehydrorhamnose 3,5-epimerase
MSFCGAGETGELMIVRSLAIPEVKLIVPSIFRDERGFFSETHNSKSFKAAGIDAEFVQDNHSLSRPKGVVRGLHFQVPPHAQGKLVRVTHGAVFDVAVDVRRGSPSYGRHVSAVLSAENWAQLWIPVGFAHGFCTLKADTEVLYKVTDYYAPECDRGIKWNDPALGIEWPIAAAEAILSAKDAKNALLSELPAYF